MAFYGRGKNRIQGCLTLADMYDEYIKDKEEIGPYNITRAEYRTIVEDYIKMVMDEILNKASNFKLPFRLGDLRVVKLDSSLGRKRRYSIDFSLTQKYGKPIYHLNEHSGGFKYMFKWSKKDMYVKHGVFYRFIPTRTNKRRLAYNIKNYITDYFDV